MGPTLIVAAHPDDETLGAGVLLAARADALVLHVTDGAPRDPAFFNGFRGSREEYARIRAAELGAAMQVASVGADRLQRLGVADQEAPLDMAGLAEAIADRLGAIRPARVITHPYEGGHPDHDATAFGVRHAASLLEARGLRAPAILEMTSYHAGPGGLVAEEFLPGPGPVTTARLSPAERELKAAMVACFGTQREVLARFPLLVERLRPAPRYDFTAPPHAGGLYYEGQGWSFTGPRWRALASEALRSLGLAA